jgi:tetratricopeptide (TPR) repeat protein
MTHREKRLALFLIAAVAVSAIFALSRVYHPRPPGRDFETARYTPGDDDTQVLDRIRAAEAIADEEARCLAYPDPPGISWDPDVVKAFCALTKRRMISWKEIKEALDHSHPEVLQRAFDGYLKQTYQPGQHGFLVWTFTWMFDNPSQDVFDTTNRWVEEDPGSAYALAARGTHYVAAAFHARGEELIRDTPPEKIQRMREFSAKARSDLKEALQKNPRLIAAYYVLMDVARLEGDIDLRESSARAALALDPADHSIYDHWMTSAEPRWGGSIDEMRDIASLAIKHRRDNPLLKRALGRPACEMASELMCSACGRKPDYEKSLELYRKSAGFGPNTCFLQNAPWVAEQAGDLASAAIYDSEAVRFLQDNSTRVRRAYVLADIGRADWAIEDMTRLIAADPKAIEALDARAWIEMRANKPHEAAASYRAILQADPANERGALGLAYVDMSRLRKKDEARTLVAGLLERNPRLARAWLYKAVLDRNDRTAYREALEKYLEYVDRSDKGEHVDIGRAEGWLKNLDRIGHG